MHGHSLSDVLAQITLAEKATRWNTCIQVLGLSRQTCLYQMRHGGASANYVEGRRSLADFQLCGRWASASDVKRCIKTGQLPTEVAECTARYNVRKMMIVTAPTSPSSRTSQRRIQGPSRASMRCGIPRIQSLLHPMTGTSKRRH